LLVISTDSYNKPWIHEYQTDMKLVCTVIRLWVQ